MLLGFWLFFSPEHWLRTVLVAQTSMQNPFACHVQGSPKSYVGRKTMMVLFTQIRDNVGFFNVSDGFVLTNSRNIEMSKQPPAERMQASCTIVIVCSFFTMFPT